MTVKYSGRRYLLISWMTLFWEEMLRSFIAFLPALVANSSPLILRNLLKNYEFTPIDFNKVLSDSERVLGSNKSWEGLAAGVCGGMLVGTSYVFLLGSSTWIIYSFLMSVGAMLGDLLNSFIKRRLKIKPGDPFIPLDQLTFLYGAYLLAMPVGNLYLGKMIKEVTLVDLAMATYLVMILHPLTNLIAYILKLKSEPW